MIWKIYDTERAGYWRIILDLNHDLGVRLSDAIDADERFSFLFYRERQDIDAFVIGVALSHNSVLRGENNGLIKAELQQICNTILSPSVTKER